MEAADGDRVFVAHLATEGARLGEANVVRFAGRPAAYDARLGREIPTMLPVAKPDCFCGHATAAVTKRLMRQNDRGRRPRVTAEMALRLEKGLGSTAETWLAMQTNYDLAHAKPVKGVERIKEAA